MVGGRESTSESCSVWAAQQATAGFEAGRGPFTRDCGLPLEAGKGKKMDSPLESPERDTALLPSGF